MTDLYEWNFSLLYCSAVGDFVNLSICYLPILRRGFSISLSFFLSLTHICHTLSRSLCQAETHRVKKHINDQYNNSCFMLILRILYKAFVGMETNNILLFLPFLNYVHVFLIFLKVEFSWVTKHWDILSICIKRTYWD